MNANNKNSNAALGLGFTILIMSLSACDQGATPDMKTSSSPGYDAGYEFGVKLALLQQQPGAELDEAFKGLLDALSETKQIINSTDMCNALQAAGTQTTDQVTEQVTESSEPYAPIRTRGFKDDFAALNAQREGVVVLNSGVQYEVLKAGNGERPQTGDAVLISYQASLTDGTVFDTTYEDGEPLHMPLDDIAVPGLKEALLLMNEGAQWQVVIPPSMGFGRSGNNQLRRRDLIYNIELISIEKPTPAST